MSEFDLPTRIGLIGCGAVSHQYLPNLLRLPELTVSAVSDIDPVAAGTVGDQYGVPATTVDAVLDDPDIKIVVNLTPIGFHVPVTRDALGAGKHVYSEKSLATSRDQAQELLALADAEGLMVGCAPDTLLGTAFQTVRRELESGSLGRPLSAVALMLRSRVPRAAYFADHKALFDMAPYYLSALVTLLGPVRTVSGYLEYDDAAAEDGLAVGVSGVLRFDSGTTADLTMNWNSTHRREIPVLDVYTDTGVLRCANPNNFGDPAYLRRHDEPDGDWREIPGSRQPADLPANQRGIGVAEMAAALAAGREPRASGELACHVVDVIESLVTAARSGRSVTLSSSCRPPAALPDGEPAHFLDPERSIR